MPQRATILNVAGSPQAAMQSLPVDAVQWTGGFWFERFRQTCDVTARSLWQLLADPDAGHVLDNFRIAAGLIKGERQGTWWQDAWLFKWIEAAACLHRQTHDSWLDERMDEGIALIAAAQEDDGYVGTQTTATGNPRFEYIRLHEVYTMGHLLTAAVTHRRMTGKTTFLDIGVKVADFLCAVLGDSVPPRYAHNPSAIMGLVELYRETGEQRYLDCARRIVDARGTEPSRRGRDLWHRADGIEGTDQIQDRVPLRRSEEVVGHNVFFTYLFAGAADLFLETGDKDLAEALERLWHDLTTRKMNVNGGVSPMGHGLSLRHDVVVEAVGAAYFLPNADSYNETCGQIGNLMWNARMLLAAPRARYAEMMEHEMYNGILSGMSTDGMNFWYRNQLRRDIGHQVHGHNDLLAREKPGRKRICCPTNVLRTLAQWQTYAYTTDDAGAWIHQYGANRAALQIPGKGTLGLEQITDYPWAGEVTIAVQSAPAEQVAIRLRIPSWAVGAELQLNGRDAETDVRQGTYAELIRTWQAGDVLTLELPMQARLVEADPLVEHCRNQVAVMRGPILYCLESVDLPGSMQLDGVCLPSDIDLKPVPMDELPFGMLALEGNALQRPQRDWQGTLYRALDSPRLLGCPIRLIPYFSWANRGPSAMSVWLPVAWR